MKTIFKNLFSLGFIQGINLLLPLVVMPFLIKIIGVPNYGIISTAQNFVGFFVLFVDFGFNITSVRQLAQAMNDQEKIKLIVNRVLFLKLVLLIISFAIYIVFVLLTSSFRQHISIYLYSFAIVIGQAALPFWYYQGIEKIHKAIGPLVIFKLLTVAVILITIRGECDAPFINLIFGLGNLFAGVVMFLAIGKRHRLSFKFIDAKSLKREFKDNIAIATANISVVLYTNSPLLILSFFVESKLVGIYSVVDRILQILKTMLSLVHQVSYPRICNIVKEEGHLTSFVKRMYGVVWSAILCICTGVYFQSISIVTFFIKETQPALFASHLLKLSSFVLFITSLNMPFYQTLLAYKRDWITVKVLFAGALISIVLNFLLVPYFNVIGTISSLYFVEVIVTGLLIYYAFNFYKSHAERKLFT